MIPYYFSINSINKEIGETGEGVGVYVIIKSAIVIELLLAFIPFMQYSIMNINRTINSMLLKYEQYTERNMRVEGGGYILSLKVLLILI